MSHYHFSLGLLSIVLIISSAIGSFASSLSYRLQNGEIFKRRSFCIKCKHTLTIKELIPIISYLLQRGKCKHCNRPINKRYPLIEATQVICGAIAFYFSQNWQDFFLIIIASFAFLVISIVDAESMLIPDSMNIILIIIAIAAQFSPNFLGEPYSIITWFNALFFVIFKYSYEFIRAKITHKNREVLGIGDLKLFFITAFMIKDIDFPFFTFSVGLTSCTLWAFFFKKEKFPFAPSICLIAFAFFVKAFQ